MSKTSNYENLFTVTGGDKHTGLKVNLRIIGIDRVVGTWKASDILRLLTKPFENGCRENKNMIK